MTGTVLSGSISTNDVGTSRDQRTSYHTGRNVHVLQDLHSTLILRSLGPASKRRKGLGEVVPVFVSNPGVRRMVKYQGGGGGGGFAGGMLL